MAYPNPTENQNDTANFHASDVTAIATSHFIHDVYTGFVPPLLPLIIEKLSLSLTMAGSLNAILQFPGLLNPLIGYLGTSNSLRYFVIFAPAVTATLLSAIGLAPSYLSLALIFFAAGISTAAFHAPAPAIAAQLSGKKVGLGMSLFMAGGELARTVAPLLGIWAISIWTLSGFFRIVVLGWAASIVLFWRLRKLPVHAAPRSDLRELVPSLRTLFLPLLIYILFRNLMTDALSVYLPTFLKFQGFSLWNAGVSYSILELAAVAGALLTGTLSDHFGRRTIMCIGTALSIVFLLLFLNLHDRWSIPILLCLGFTAFSTTPVIMAMVQDQLPNHRAVGNGIYMTINFLTRPLTILTIGVIGDTFGLRPAYYFSALFSLLALPVIFMLPAIDKQPTS